MAEGRGVAPAIRRVPLGDSLTTVADEGPVREVQIIAAAPTPGLPMKWNLTLCLLCAAWTFGPAGALAQTEGTEPAFPEELSERVYSHWTIFSHPRYGYELPVPPGVRSVGVPEDAARTTFVSPDRAFEMSAWGGIVSQPSESVMDTLWKRAKSAPGRTVTQSRRSQTWYVVVGSDRTGSVFYEKFTTRGNHAAWCSLKFPRSRVREFQPWLTGIERGFRPSIPLDGTVVAAPAAFAEVDDSSTVETNVLTTVPRELDSELEPEDAEGTVNRNESKLLPSPRSTQPAARTHSLATIPKSSKSIPLPSSPDLAPQKLEPTPFISGVPALTKKPDESAAATQDIPFGEKVPDRPGFVYTPFHTEKTLVDVEGISPGTKVKCPYTGKIFRVP